MQWHEWLAARNLDWVVSFKAARVHGAFVGYEAEVAIPNSRHGQQGFGKTPQDAFREALKKLKVEYE